jgi:HK97 family phage prohead protease
MIQLIASDFGVDAAAANGTPRRTISGTAVPYGIEAQVSGGQSVIFQEGSLPVDGKNPRLFMYHDSSMPVGVVTERVNTPQGMMFSAKISATALGNDALTMAGDGTIDQVSVGINPTKWHFDDNGTMIIEAAQWTELSLVPIAAFGDLSNIASVAATADESIHQPLEEITNIETEVHEQEQEVMEQVSASAPQPEQVPASAIVFAEPKREFRMPSSGEYLAAYHRGGQIWADVNSAYQAAVNKNKSAFEFAAGDVATTNTPGLLPVPVLGPLVQDINFVRPVIQAVGARAFPDGGASKTFVRPTITTHTSVGAQSAEFDAASATTMVIASNTISKTTFAGQVSLSVQDIDFTSPSAMQLILNDLMGEYMLATDNFAADNLLTAATSSGVWDLTAADLMKSIYDAAVDVANNRNWMPTHLFVSPDVWGQLGQVADSAGRPLFPFVGAGLTGQNALGNLDAGSWNGTPLGLQIVVDSNFAAKTMIITRVGTGMGDAYEVYEAQRGMMSVELPSTLGRQFSYHGYVSTFAAIGGMIRKITQA